MGLFKNLKEKPTTLIFLIQKLGGKTTTLKFCHKVFSRISFPIFSQIQFLILLRNDYWSELDGSDSSDVKFIFKPILVTQLKYLRCAQKQGMNLKYLDFNNCFSILSKFAFLLPNLVEIRIGSDAPPQMRLTTARLLVDNSQLVSQMQLVPSPSANSKYILSTLKFFKHTPFLN